MPLALDYRQPDTIEVATKNAPLWLGDPTFHASHRSNLLRKDPVFYGKHGWSEPTDLPYVWPTKELIFL